MQISKTSPGLGRAWCVPADVQHKSYGCTLAVPLWLGQAFAEAKGGSELRGKIDQHHNYTRIPRCESLFQRVSKSTKSCSSCVFFCAVHQVKQQVTKHTLRVSVSPAPRWGFRAGALVTFLIAVVHPAQNLKKWAFLFTSGVLSETLKAPRSARIK